MFKERLGTGDVEQDNARNFNDDDALPIIGEPLNFPNPKIEVHAFVIHYPTMVFFSFRCFPPSPQELSDFLFDTK